MNTNMLATAAKLSDVALLERLEALAERAREATVPSSIRKLPAPASAPQPVAPAVAAAPSREVAPASEPDAGTLASGCTSSTAHRPVVEPLSPERYRVQFTVGKETQEKLRRVQDLLRREIPDGDPGAIFDRALTLLLREAEKKAFSQTTRPRPLRPATPGTRTIPAHVQRAVWKRDSGQCAFVGGKGRCCTQRTYLEFHHVDPHACGGEAIVDNISLRCRLCRARHKRHYAESRIMASPVFGPGSVTAGSVRDSA